jgi:16S rRNA (guanine527-N7)-methyltransferase
VADADMRVRHPDKLAPEDLLAKGALALGIHLSSGQLLAFRLYREELARWSARTNLTALREPAEIIREGFLDSLACLPFVPSETCRVLDIGSGAGFPSIPLKIVRPALEVTLVEASRKKSSFLRHIVRILDLQGARVVQIRAEELAADPAEQGKYDLAFARAVAPLPGQVQLTAPFVRPGGLFLAQVGYGTVWAATGTGGAGKNFEVAGEFALPPLLGRSDRRVLRLQRLPGGTVA